MKKNFFGQMGILMLLFLVISCQEEEPELENLVAPTNVAINAVVSTDQSGNVIVTPTADNAINFHVIFLPEADPVVINTGQSANFRFTQSGQYSAPITVVAFAAGGVSSSATVQIDLDVRLRIAPEVLAQIAGGDGTTASSRRWIWDQNVGGHFGVGPLTNDFPEFFSAGPSQLNPCMYDDVLVFSHDGNDNYSYVLEPGDTNETFINWTEVNRFFPDATPQQFADECRVITDQAVFDTNFVIIDNEDGSQSLDVGTSFLSYWAVIPGQYEILELSENRLALRGISQPFNGDDPLAWYSVFIPEDLAATGGGNPINTQFTNLVWSDEFDVPGAPNPANWTYDLGGGGWGNGESQTYTTNAENVIVEDGNLKITAKTSGGGTDTVYYYDNFELADASGNSQQIIEDFEGAAPTFNGFGGGESTLIANPDASGENTSANVAQFTKSATAETFAGSFFDLTTPLDLSTNNRMIINTWSPSANVVVRLKIENTADGSQFFELDANTTTANSWETLSFDLSAAPAFNYDRLVIFFDFGTAGAGGSGYTSARIKSEDLQEFTYGRVEARAKLPTGGGTWPAIWMLGANFPEVGWPTSGEIDIMEHVGNRQNEIFGSTHDPNNFGGNARTGSTIVSGVSNEFHIYEIEWTATQIKFAVDGDVYHTVTNDGSLPFNSDFFFIMNVAMGGTFGGDIDAGFTESSMEVDYIRMYQ
jgi:beta-glucanase (GH16 family)